MRTRRRIRELTRRAAPSHRGRSVLDGTGRDESPSPVAGTGLVCLWYADPDAERADATGAVDEKGWTLDGTMPVPPTR